MRAEFERSMNRAALYDENNELVGESTFSASETTWIIDHTYVNDALRGNGYASKLVEKIIENAREANVKIVPLCPYAKKEFAKHPEYSDVLFSTGVRL